MRTWDVLFFSCLAAITIATDHIKNSWSLRFYTLIEYSFVFFLYNSLKRTTDVMFGGKQVVVCGYGEVR